MELRRGIIESTRPDQYIGASANASGVASGFLGPCPEGFEWYVDRATCGQSGAAVGATALIELYVQMSKDAPSDQSKQGRQVVLLGATVGNAQLQIDQPIVVPPGYFLVAVWTNLTSADKVQLSTQIQVRRLILEHAVEHRAQRHAHMIEHTVDPKHGDLEAIPVVVGDELAQV